MDDHSVLVDETQTQTNTEAHFTEPHIINQHEKTILRVIRVPMELPNKTEMKKLRMIAGIAADYANAAMAEWWVKKKWQIDKTPSTYVDYGALLSSYARDAISDHVKSIIRRDGKRILRSELQLPTFVKDRALSVRADTNHRGGKCWGETISIKPQQEWLTFRVHTKALRTDWYLADTLAKLQTEEYAIKRIAVVIGRRGDLFFHIAYSKSLLPTNQGTETAALIFNETGELWLNSGTRRLNLTHRVHRLRHMKLHFAGIQSRLKRSLGRSGDRQRLRRALLKRQTYAQWSEGPIGQLAAEVMRWCLRFQVGTLNVTLPRDGFVAWHEILQRLQNCAEECGIVIVQIENEELQRDWKRLAQMADAQRKFLRMGPPYDIYADDPEIGTLEKSGEKGDART